MNNYKEMFNEFIKYLTIESYIQYLKNTAHTIKENGLSIQNDFLNQLKSFELNLSAQDTIQIIQETISNKQFELENNQKYSLSLLNNIFIDKDTTLPFSSRALDLHNIQSSFIEDLIRNKDVNLLNFKITTSNIEYISNKVLSNITFDQRLKEKIKSEIIIDTNIDLAEAMINEFIKLSKELKHTAILNNNGIDQSIECGWMWQFHSYIEETSYREIRVTLESEKDCNDIQLILGDDILDYDGVSAEEVQYYKTYTKDILGLNKLISDVQSIAKTINENGDNPDRFHDYEENLLHLGLESRY